jgi:hypothetical protein
MLYKVVHCFPSIALPNNLSSQNIISEPSLIENNTKQKNYFSLDVGDALPSGPTYFLHERRLVRLVVGIRRGL